MMEKYSKEDVFNETLKYFSGDTMATDVWINKYCLKDNEGNLYEKNPEDMHKRLANEFYRIEKKYANPMTYDEILNLFKNFKYVIPGGSPMAGIGNPFSITSLSNCFVKGAEDNADSYGSICYVDECMVQMSKRRGGVGHDMSHIRPNGAKVTNAALTSTGVVPFMERYSNTIREVGQGGRRGALLLSINIKHPDAEDFIDAKMDTAKVTGANISVAITDDFMNKAIKNEKFIQCFPINYEFSNEEEKYILDNFELNKIVEYKHNVYVKVVDAKALYDKLIYNNWKSAEPGILFIDTIHRNGIADAYPKFKTISTNPCVTGDTIVTTDKGNIRIDELINRFNNGESFSILSYNEKNKELSFSLMTYGYKTRSNAEIVEIECSNGKKIKLTPDHMVYTTEKGWVNASDIDNKYTLITISEDETNSISTTHCVVNSVKYLSDVYDISVDINHNFFGNGILIHNCGEITLSDSDSCRLMAINAFNYVVNPFTENSYLDVDKLRSDAGKAQRLMDDLIDLEVEKIDQIILKIKSDPESDFIKSHELHLWEKIKDTAIKGRRTGLGFTAIGDAIAAMGKIYGTNEGNEIGELIVKTACIGSFEETIKLAKERGAFPEYNYDIEHDHKYIKQMIEFVNDKCRNDYEKYGRRNVSMTTIAPTGSTSILTQTTSGIEPVFKVSYRRRRKINTNETNVNVTFTDKTGDQFTEYNIVHPTLIKWYNIVKCPSLTYSECENELKNMDDETINKLISESPYYMSSANEIDWVGKVDLQSRCQKWISHSISNTTNLPNDISVDVVQDIYTTAWKKECKGVTIYRDGSRDGILISKDTKNDCNCMSDVDAPKRPKVLKAVINRFNNDKDKWIAFIGLMDGRPYEIFTGLLEKLNIPNYVTECDIVKVKNVEQGIKRYDVVYVDKNGDKQRINGIDTVFNPIYWNYAKLISGILRHKMPLPSVILLINSLRFDSELINTWKNGVVRTLKKFVKDGTKLNSAKCPKCGGELIFQENCFKCVECGESKCG